MNKGELVSAVHSLTTLPKTSALIAVDAVLDSIKDGLYTDKKVNLAGFGTFQIVERKARKARNPRTGDTVNVPRKMFVKFKPSLDMKGINYAA